MSRGRALTGLVFIPVIGGLVAWYRLRRRPDNADLESADATNVHTPGSPLISTTHETYGATEDRPARQRDESGPSIVDSMFSHDRATSAATTVVSGKPSPAESEDESETTTEVFRRETPHHGKVSVALLQLSGRTVYGRIDRSDAVKHIYARWTADNCASGRLDPLTLAGSTFHDTPCSDGHLAIDTGGRSIVLAVCAVDEDGREHWDSNSGANYTITI